MVKKLVNHSNTSDVFVDLVMRAHSDFMEFISRSLKSFITMYAKVAMETFGMQKFPHLLLPCMVKYLCYCIHVII